MQNASTKRWSTADLNLWSASDKGASNVGILDSGEKVLITGRAADGRSEVVVDGAARWVTSEYLSDEKPEEGPPALGGSCTNGTSCPDGVSRQHRQGATSAVCAAFPDITTYGTFRGDGEHSPGPGRRHHGQRCPRLRGRATSCARTTPSWA